MITLGVLCKYGRIHFLEAIFFVQLGLLPANSFMVFLGNQFGVKLFKIRPFSLILNQSFVETSMRYLNQYGSISIFVTRFIPIIRGPMYFAIGLSKIKLRRFFTYDAIAACVPSPLLILLGKSLTIQADSILQSLHYVGIFAVAAILLFLLKLKLSNRSAGL